MVICVTWFEMVFCFWCPIQIKRMKFQPMNGGGDGDGGCDGAGRDEKRPKNRTVLHMHTVILCELKYARNTFTLFAYER